MSEAETEEKQFSKGVEVLARWRDGIWYLANVIEVDEKGKRCQVVFEDGTVVWLFHKDLQSSLRQLDLQCMMCNDGTSKKPNEIVLCDQCEQGYHQKCHSPEITSDVLQTNAEWFCRQCVFGNSAKAGGAAKQGPDAEALRSLKRSLPYNLDSLHWDNKHKSNKEDLYCYCGGPGDWSSKMLQCNRCQQWFHEACIQCLNHPLLSGDRFYIFVCGVCNEGKEYIKRLKLRWGEVAHFALYYLSTTYKKKFHNPEDILDYVDDHWDTFQLGESNRASRKEAHEAIKDVLRSTPSRFRQSSSEPFSYSLKNRTPPQPPKLTEPLPPPGTVADEEAETTGVQQGKRGRKRRHASPVVGSSTDDHSEAKSRKTNKTRDFNPRFTDERASERKAKGKPKGSKSQTKEAESPQGEGEGESVPMFPSPSMFKYLYSSSSRSPEDSTTPSSAPKDAASSATSTSTLSTDTVMESVSEQRTAAESAAPVPSASSAQQPLKINFVPDPVSKGTSEDKPLEPSPAVELAEETAAPGNADSSVLPQPLKTSEEDTRQIKVPETVPPTEQRTESREKEESGELEKQQTGEKEICGEGGDTVITSEKEESRDGERKDIDGTEPVAGGVTEVEKVASVETSHAIEDVDVMQGSHIVSHVMEFEEPAEMETEGQVIGESTSEEQNIQQEVSVERLVTEDVEDYVMISHVTEGNDRMEADESKHVTDQSSDSGNAESSGTTGGDNLDKTESENLLAEEEDTGANSEFVLVMEESLEDEGDSLQEIREENDGSVSTNGHAAEEGTPLGVGTNGVTLEKKNEVGVTDETSDCMTEENPTTDVEKNKRGAEDSGVQIICHATEEKYHIVVESKSQAEQLVEPSVLVGSHASQLIHSQVEEKKDCVTQAEASAAVDTFESKAFITDTDYEMIPVQHYHTEEK